jgi:hypothetical protein
MTMCVQTSRCVKSEHVRSGCQATSTLCLSMSNIHPLSHYSNKCARWKKGASGEMERVQVFGPSKQAMLDHVDPRKLLFDACTREWDILDDDTILRPSVIEASHTGDIGTFTGDDASRFRQENSPNVTDQFWAVLTNQPLLQEASTPASPAHVSISTPDVEMAIVDTVPFTVEGARGIYMPTIPTLLYKRLGFRWARQEPPSAQRIWPFSGQSNLGYAISLIGGVRHEPADPQCDISNRGDLGMGMDDEKHLLGFLSCLAQVGEHIGAAVGSRRAGNELNLPLLTMSLTDL